MRPLHELDQFRDRAHERLLWGSFATPQMAAAGGFFRVPVKSSRRPLTVIASDGSTPEGMGWDHVSVSLPARCPTWEEMCLIKDLFFLPDEVAFQLHPRTADNISNHRYCLHVWRPVAVAFPEPPGLMVGIKGLGELRG